MEKMMLFNGWFVTCFSVGKPFYRQDRSFAIVGGELQPKRCGSEKSKEVYDSIRIQQMQGKKVIRLNCSASALACALSGVASPDGDLKLRPILY